MVKPAYHKRVYIHGMNFDLRKPGLRHFDTTVAHLKEWRGILVKHRKDVTYRPPLDFNASKNEEVDMVHFERGHKRVDGKVLMHYDKRLQEWMQFVASGCDSLDAH